MRTLFVFFCVLLLSAPAQSSPPVVIELFTSQGCSSCPPAEKLFNELADNDDIIPLAFHVDYWDYIGWKDPYASPHHTDRQRKYGVNTRSKRVYTPQVVINGKHETVGSNWREINRLFEKSRKEKTFSFSLALAKKSDEFITLTITNNTNQNLSTQNYDIWLFSVLDKTENHISRGENRGKNMSNRNVVHSTYHLGSWAGDTQKLDLERTKLGDVDSFVVIVQEEHLGAIAGAAKYILKQ